MSDYLERQRQQGFAKGIVRILSNRLIWKIILFLVVIQVVAKLLS